MNKLILSIINSILSTTCPQISFPILSINFDNLLEKENLHVLSHEYPYSNIEFSFINEHRPLNILLNYETETLGDLIETSGTSKCLNFILQRYFICGLKHIRSQYSLKLFYRCKDMNSNSSILACSFQDPHVCSNKVTQWHSIFLRILLRRTYPKAHRTSHNHFLSNNFFYFFHRH